DLGAPDLSGPDAGDSGPGSTAFDGAYAGTITIGCLGETRPFEFTVTEGELRGGWSASIAGGEFMATLDAEGEAVGTTTVVVRTPRGECDVAGTFTEEGNVTGTFSCTDSIICEGTWEAERDGGTAPDPEAQTRLTAANERFAAASCACDLGVFETAEICESFGRSDEADACAETAFTTHFATVGGFFTCIAELNEDLADCYEAAEDCDTAALAACNDAAEEAERVCPAVPDAEATEYRGTLTSCTVDNVIGPDGTCPDASDAVSTTGPAVFTGSTIGAGNDLAAPAGCITVRGGGNSPDRAFLWSAPSAGEFTFDTLGSSFDTVLYVLDGCEGDESFGCNDDTGTPGDFRSSLTATLTEGQEVLVVVEGFSFRDAGDFVVNITPEDS
ncbi:MAG: hypothetical protein AAF645_29970, partial [Myxococcota bacterium]